MAISPMMAMAIIVGLLCEWTPVKIPYAKETCTKVMEKKELHSSSS